MNPDLGSKRKLEKIMTHHAQTAQQKTGKHRFPLWRFWFPLTAQMLIVLAVPVPKAITLAIGETVYLSTVPVDPYDLLRGRYVTLNYQIQTHATLRELPGWSEDNWDEIFITLMPPQESKDPTAAWQAVAVDFSYPDTVEPGHVVIRGEQSRRGIDFGLGEYYIPEDIGDALEEDIRDHPRETRAEVKVDRWGSAALVDIWVEDREY